MAPEPDEIDRDSLPDFMKISPVEVTKLQAAYVVPIVKAFVEEIGMERALEIVERALEPVRRREAELGITMLPGDTYAERMRTGMRIFSEGDALDVDYLEETEQEYDFDVKGCKWAEFFHSIGEPEIGFVMCCNGDRAIADHLPGISMDRTQTIMQGAGHCDFRWHVDPSARVPVSDSDFVQEPNDGMRA